MLRAGLLLTLMGCVLLRLGELSSANFGAMSPINAWARDFVAVSAFDGPPCA